MRRRFAMLLAVMSMLMALGVMPYTAMAYEAVTVDAMETAESVRYVNETTGYTVVISDEAELLSAYEEEALVAVMTEVTEYGDVGFVSIDYNEMLSTEDYARYRFHELFDSGSGTLFLIDMDYRELYIFSDGAIYRTVTSNYANSIADNVYRFASDGEYADCAKMVFLQELQLLRGSRIAQPMKYVSNLFLAVIAAILINYVLVIVASRTRKASIDELLKGIYSKQAFDNARSELVNTTKVYSPRSSSSSSGSSGSRSGSSRSSGSSGGGRSSGGGGGHRF